MSGVSIAARLTGNLIKGYPWRPTVADGRRGTERASKRRGRWRQGDTFICLGIWVGKSLRNEGNQNLEEIVPHTLSVVPRNYISRDEELLLAHDSLMFSPVYRRLDVEVTPCLSPSLPAAPKGVSIDRIRFGKVGGEVSTDECSIYASLRSDIHRVGRLARERPRSPRAGEIPGYTAQSPVDLQLAPRCRPVPR